MNQDNNSVKPSAATATRRLAPKTAMDGDDSAKFDTNQLLLETASRVDNAICELMDYVSILSEQSNSDKSNLKLIGDNIKQTIVPVLYIASRSLRVTGTAFAPVAATKAVFDRLDAQRRREVVNKRLITEKSAGIQMMDDFVKRSAIEVPEQPHRAIKQQRTFYEVEAKETIAILRPANGIQYTKTEFIQAVTMYEKGKRALAKRAIEAKGFAPAHFQTLDRLVREYEADGTLPDPEFNEFVGRPRKGENFAGLPGAPISKLADIGATAAMLKPESGGNLIQVTLDKVVYGRKRKRKEESESLSNNLETIEIDPTQKKNRVEVAAASVAATTDLPPNQSSTDCTRISAMKEKSPAKALVVSSPPVQNANTSPKKIIEAALSVPGTKQLSNQPSSTSSTPKPDMKEYPAEVVNFPLPPPQNGNTYTKPEAVNVVKQYKKKTRERALAMRAMICRGYFPGSVRMINRLLERDAEGIPIFDTPFTKGRPRLLTDDEVGTLIAQKQAEGSSTLPDVEAMKNLLMQKKKRSGEGATSASGKKVPSMKNAVISLTPRPYKKKSSDEAKECTLPLPQNGSTYTKSEAVNVAKQFKKQSRERGLAIETMIKKGYVPGSARTMQRLLERDAEGKPIMDTDWATMGRTSVLSNDEVDAIVDQLKQHYNGDMCLMGKVDIKQVVKNAIREKAAKLGGTTSEGETDAVQCSDSCIRSYEVIIMSKLGSSL
jgi:hypothetical protein